LIEEGVYEEAILGVKNGRFQWMGEAKTGIKPMVEIECRGEPCVRPRTKTSIEPMVKPNSAPEKTRPIAKRWFQKTPHVHQRHLNIKYA